MNKLACIALLTVVSISLAETATPSAAPITTGQLLKEMTDMNRLTREALPHYKTVQFSSYDRRSNLPGGPNWYANADGFGNEPIPAFEEILREPDAEGVGEYLICDVKSPGAIVRTWTAAMGGTLRVVLDDQKTPLYEGPVVEFLQSPYTSIAKINKIKLPQAEGLFKQRQAGYCPIPFSKRCRITWTGKQKKVHFYQVQIREYPEGTKVKTFQPSDLTTYALELERTLRILAAPAEEIVYANNEGPVVFEATIAKHSKAEVFALSEPKAIERLTLKLEAADLDLALRQTLLKIYFDGYQWPQVEAPVGDFFGAAPGINPYDSLAFTVEPDGTMTCRYIMPFEKKVRIVLDNMGDQTVSVKSSVLPMAYAWDDHSLHFRARWRVDHDVTGWGKSPQDMPYLVAFGSGRYVGSALMLLNPCQGVSTPWGSWWGEGDEKIFVDDDEFPSTFGTGSEDYFNYAWSSPDIFVYSYCGQPRNDGPGNRGFITNYRWHYLDDLPFRHRIAFFMELFPHDLVPNMSYARIGYHYAKPGCVDDHVRLTQDDLRPVSLPETWEPAAAFTLKNATIYAVEKLVPNKTGTEMSKDSLWAGGDILQWSPSAKGDTLDLKFKVDEARKYQLHIVVALTPEGGTIETSLDGKPVSFSGDEPTLNLYVPYRTLSRRFVSTDIELSKGEHTLTVTFLDAPEVVKQPKVGLDFFAIKPKK